MKDKNIKMVFNIVNKVKDLEEVQNNISKVDKKIIFENDNFTDNLRTIYEHVFDVQNFKVENYISKVNVTKNFV